jgi:UDP-glucose 4-epimerase
MRTHLGFEPAFTTAAAFADFAGPLAPSGGRTDRALARLAERLPDPDAAPALGRNDHG